MGVLAANAAWVATLMAALWLASVRLRDVSIVDPFWPIAFLLVTARTAWARGATPGKLVLLACVAAWALRLFLHLLARARGRAEDPRYAAFRQRYGPARYWWVSLFQVFLLQGTLALAISAPLQLAAAAASPDPLAANDVVGLALFSAGFACEAVADAQLARFRADPASQGRVLDHGLWRYSRHPNYFGEALLGWGFWCFALDEPYGWATVLAPLLLTFLLLRVSGVTLLEPHLRAHRPGYADYVARTSAFVPWPPATLTGKGTGPGETG